MNPFQSALKWLLRIAFSFLAVTVLLSAWFMIKEEYRVYGSAQSELTRLRNAKRVVEERRQVQEKSFAQWFESLQQATAEQLLAHILKLEGDIQRLESGQLSAYDKSMAFLKGDLDPLKREADLLIQKKALAHLRMLHESVANWQSKESALISLENLQREHVAAYEALLIKEKAWQDFRSENCREIWGMRLEEPCVIPFSSEWRQLKKLEEEYRALFQANQEAHEKYQQQEAFLKSIRLTTVTRFAIPPEYAERVLRPMNEKISELEAALQTSWTSHFAGPVSAAIPVAFGIILLALLTPLMIKTFLYFVIAPLVSRRQAICLMPDVSGKLHGSFGDHPTEGRASTISAVSQEMFIEEDQELLVHPEYLQSTSISGKKDTKFLLDWSIPLTSLLAGLVVLTRIRGARHAACVISSTKDPLSEVGVIEIPHGAALVIQPRYLVGMVKGVEAPIAITRRWQLKRLNAWLTLQIRYFIFHGPTKLIVKGCRGIRVERAGSGRSINQAATIGFSANLMYAPKRCETFVPYLRGKQELFNDHFSGEEGYYIYEEMPNEGKKSTLLFGRGLEGLLDTFMRIFGI